MSSIIANNQLFSATAASIKNISIDDKLLRQLSTNVRKVVKTLQDWIELSTDWDLAVGRLRRADWQLRNDPTPLNATHQAFVDLNDGIKLLEGLYNNMSSDIQEYCTNILASGKKILENKASELTNVVLKQMENDKLNMNVNENYCNTESESSCCGETSSCCMDDDNVAISNKTEEVKVAEPVVEKSSGGCGCGCNC